MKVSFHIDGLDGLDANLARLTRATARNTLRRVLMRAGEPIAEEARRLAPDDPATSAPDLRSSIAVSAKLKNPVGKSEFASVMRAGGTKGEASAAMRQALRDAAGEGSFAEVYVGPSKGGAHGVLQEFGTVNHGPQPFMRPAFDQKKGAALDIIKRDLGTEIDKAVSRAAARAARKAGAT